MKRFLSFSLSILLATSVFAQNAVNSFLSTPGLSHANISLLVKNTANGQTILSHRADKGGIPASTTKVITTATALELLGPDFKFETVLQYDGNIVNGTLKGNIYIHGGADPTLGSKYMGDKNFLTLWMLSVKGLGIKKIEGSIISDVTLFDSQGICPRWLWEDMGNYYAAPTYALSAFDNTCKVYFKTGATGSVASVIKTEPDIDSLKIVSNAKAAKVNDDNVYFYGSPMANERIAYGTLPYNRESFVSKSDIPNPPLFLAKTFTKTLADNGIPVTGKAKVMATKEKGARMRVSFYVTESPKLSEIISNINHISNNHYAEHLYRYLGSMTKDNLGVYSGSEKIKSYWKTKGLDVSELLQYDGCGLSPCNSITTNFMVSLLTYEKKQGRCFTDFYNSLPIAGVNGTVKSLFKGTALAGRVHAKSGSISGTQCYAGYVEKNGQTYAFAVMVNNFNGSRKNVVCAIENLFLNTFK